MRQFLDFEKSVAELEIKVGELREAASRDPDDKFSLQQDIDGLQNKIEERLKQLYAKLTPHQKVQVARHPERPHAVDYIKALTTDFQPLAGDRAFAEDCAIIGGIARFEGRPVVVIGTERGFDMESRVKHNFGMAKPEGYRKAQRLMELADRFGLPIVTFVDTAGAWPGIDAEARGQAQAIAKSIDVLLGVKVPTVAVIIGEGGSGGAIAIAASDKVLILEHAIYSVISPEAAASILWRDPKLAPQAAEALNLTAQQLEKLKLIDEIVSEPVGGAQRIPHKAFENVRKAIDNALAGLVDLKPEALLRQRRERFLSMTGSGEV